MVGLKIAILLLSMLTFTFAIGPTPRCKPNFYYSTLPLIADEAAILNLDELFDGYNLNFTLSGTEEWSQYLTLS